MSLKANAMDYCITKEWISKFDILTHHGRPIFSRFMARVAQIYSCNTTFISVDDYENFMNTRIGVDPSDNNSQRYGKSCLQEARDAYVLYVPAEQHYLYNTYSTMTFYCLQHCTVPGTCSSVVWSFLCCFCRISFGRF
jgi:hypothetical protein